MEKDNIQEYINKLKILEKEISDEDNLDGDMDFIGELDNLLGKLSADIQQSYVTPSPNMEVKIKKLHPDAIIPTYSKLGDAGMDLTITSIKENTTFSVTYGFGIAMEIPTGFVGLVFPRSSVRNYELSLTNCVGVIDSGYRGELQATYRKHGGLDSLKYVVGDRGAQIMILPYPQISFVETDTLSNTDRSDGGFGSTGK
jgi:dUTP pyrophosphatase